MKNSLIALLTAVLIAGASLSALADTKSLSLDIKGMSCGMCAAKIENNLKKLDGVSKSSIDHKTGKGTVEYDESKVTSEKIVETCNKTGFKCQTGG